MQRELELSCRLLPEFRTLQPGDAMARFQLYSTQLDTLIEEKVLKLRAAEQSIVLSDNDEARLEAEVQRAAEPYGGLAGLRDALYEVGVPYEYFRERKRTNLLISKLLLANISKEIFVKPEALRQYYEEHQSRFETPGELRVRQVVVFPSADVYSRPNPPPALTRWTAAERAWDPQAYAEAARQAAIDGESFEQVAAEFSMGIDYDQELRFRGKSDLRELNRALVEAIEALEIGEVSPVVETERGTRYVFALVDRRDPGVLPLEEVQQDIDRTLKDEIWNRRLREWIDELVEVAHVRRFLQPPR